MKEGIVKIERLVKSGEVNANGVLFDVGTLNRALDKYIDRVGKVLFDGHSMEDLNRLILCPKTTDVDFEEVGVVDSYDETHLFIKPTNSEFDFSDMKINIWAKTSRINKLKNGDKLALIDEVERILIKNYTV